MKNHCKILLFVVVWILYSVKGVFCEEQKLSIENRSPERYSKESDNIQEYDDIERYERLRAYGDYSKLKLIIRTAKKDHRPGGLIVVKFYVRNDSDSEVHLKYNFPIQSFSHSWKLFHSNYDEVAKTAKGEEWVQTRFFPKDDRYRFSASEGGHYIKLQPGKEWESSQVRLSDYFDLSKPDTYELTCFLATACFGQYYEPPLQSNTLTFRVLEDGEKAEVVEDGLNPPKGEEVFKQPKPPKSVFYRYDTFHRRRNTP